jgi:DNA-binding transcriptional LysR family regulator
LSDRIRRRIKLQDLHVLMTVVKAGTMGKAAERLRITQPAISRSIAGLEHALGVRLLDRYRRGVEPTEYGRALLDGGAAVFDDLHRAVTNIEFLADPTAGSIRIGCTPVLTGTFVSAVVDRFSRRYQRVVIDVATMDTDVMPRELSERNVDFLVARKFAPIVHEQLDFEMLYDDSFVVVAGARNPLAHRRKMELADLANEPWVLPRSTTALGLVLAEALRASGLDHRRTTVFTGHSELRANLLASGRFLSILSNSELRFSTARSDVKVLPVQLPLAQVPVGIVTLRNRTPIPVAQLFIDCAREIAKPPARRRP